MAQPAWPKGVAKPAQRALANAGITRLEQLASAREADVAALHGMGPKALDILKAAMAARGLSFAGYGGALASADPLPGGRTGAAGGGDLVLTVELIGP